MKVERIARTIKLFSIGAVLGGLLCIAACAMPGCQSPTSIASAGSAASAGLGANLDTAHSEIDATAPHADSIGKAHLASADAAISSGKSKLPAINAGLSQVAPLQSQVDKLKKQFFSPRQIGLIWVVGGSIGALLIVLCILYFCTPLAAPIGTIAAGAFHTLTLGLTKLGSTIASKIESNVAAAKTAISKATTSSTPSTAAAVPSVATPKGMT